MAIITINFDRTLEGGTTPRIDAAVLPGSSFTSPEELESCLVTQNGRLVRVATRNEILTLATGGETADIYSLSFVGLGLNLVWAYVPDLEVYFEIAGSLPSSWAAAGYEVGDTIPIVADNDIGVLSIGGGQTVPIGTVTVDLDLYYYLAGNPSFDPPELMMSLPAVEVRGETSGPSARLTDAAYATFGTVEEGAAQLVSLRAEAQALNDEYDLFEALGEDFVGESTEVFD